MLRKRNRLKFKKLFISFIIIITLSILISILLIKPNNTIKNKSKTLYFLDNLSNKSKLNNNVKNNNAPKINTTVDYNNKKTKDINKLLNIGGKCKIKINIFNETTKYFIKIKEIEGKVLIHLIKEYKNKYTIEFLVIEDGELKEYYLNLSSKLSKNNKFRKMSLIKLRGQNSNITNSNIDYYKIPDLGGDKKIYSPISYKEFLEIYLEKDGECILNDGIKDELLELYEKIKREI